MVVRTLSASASRYIGAWSGRLATAVFTDTPSGWVFTYEGCESNHDHYGPFPSLIAAESAALNPRKADPLFVTFFGDFE